jgi:hypothetical protein
MKMKCKQVALTTFVFFIFSLFAVSAITLFTTLNLYGQEVDLVKLKKEEEERKKKAKKSKYKVTNENLDKIKVAKKPYSVIKLEEGKGAAGASGSSTPDKSGGEGAPNQGDNLKEDKTKPEYWQKKVTKLLDDMDETKENINQMKAELNQTMNTWSVEHNLQKQKEKKKKVADLRELIPKEKQKLEKLEKDMAALEEDARKNNVPPGWLRVDRTKTPTPPEKPKQRDQQK